MIAVVSRRPVRRPLGAVPAPRGIAAAPRRRPVAAVPKGGPIAQAPVPEVTRAPAQRPVGKVPNPRKPKLVRDVGGNELKDLFALFPDLPRPRRPAPRLPKKSIRRRM
jgi:hypothetical protein